ncbi:YraN family protein [Candidatus Uhrbacteria bacterium]|nr:YraN family protein [Candidatus Uhrbacteria bacterium]
MIMVGDKGEGEAQDFLARRGYAILKRKYRVKGGEIDIIARVKDTLVFVEVKARSSSRFGYPEEAVGGAKKRRIARAARAYLRAYPQVPQMYIRFDIIALSRAKGADANEIRHIQDVDIGEELL